MAKWISKWQVTLKERKDYESKAKAEMAKPKFSRVAMTSMEERAEKDFDCFCTWAQERWVQPPFKTALKRYKFKRIHRRQLVPAYQYIDIFSFDGASE